jgi:uncharacterized repeat protein (TIGR01451 family)
MRAIGGSRAQSWTLGTRAVLLGVLLAVVLSGSAAAAPVFELQTYASSTAVPGGTMQYVVVVQNVGDTPLDGSPFAVTVTLPQGLTLRDATPWGLFVFWDCDPLVVGSQTVTCANDSPLNPVIPFVSFDNRRAWLLVSADVASDASGVRTAQFAVAGAGGEPASAQEATLITDEPPAFGLEAFDALTSASPAPGDLSTQAGAHPYALTTRIKFQTFTDPIHGLNWPVAPNKTVLVDLPPGVLGDPTAVPQCEMGQLTDPGGNPTCPSGSQVGLAGITTAVGRRSATPIYNMVPADDVPARFAFNIAGTVIVLEPVVRTGSDYGLTVSATNAPERLAITSVQATFWGVPADSRHDPARACPGLGTFGCSTDEEPKPFLRNPTSCTGPVQARVSADSWVEPNVFKTASFTVPAITGCDQVLFDPRLSGRPPSPAMANQPSGFSFDLTIPQNEIPDGLAPSDLRKAVVTLPAGVRVSPSSAHGLQGCAPEQIKLNSDAAPTCPDGSKIGTVQIQTPLLEDPLEGEVFLATPFKNPAGTMVALYLVAHGHGVTIKLDGRVDLDPDSGQITTTFDHNPQLPFENLHLELFDGPQAALVLPSKCGTYTTHAVLTGWSGKIVNYDSHFTVDYNSNGGPCETTPKFAPSFEAGTLNPIAGTYSPFIMNLARDDNDEELATVDIDMPTGMLARLNGVPRCPAAQAAAGTCGSDTKVGIVTAGAGAGPTPFILTGGVYLSGPYKGAPFSLSIVVPAKAGPFDLGNVVVRAALRIDRRTAEVDVDADPLPTILQGIPLQTRIVRVLIDRKRFFLNPTSCKEKRIDGTLGSTEGSTAHVSSPFQVVECGRLALRPRISFRVGGKGHTRSGGSTSLLTTLTQTRGQTGLKSVRVQLPLVLNGDLDVIQDACTEEEFAAGPAEHCAKARTGVATAKTPLLAEPLKGSAYFVEHSGKGLPNLVIALRGEVDVDLVGRVVIPRSNKLGTAFAAIPDVPISKFQLKLFAGRNGSIGTTANLCSRKARRARASVRFVGQNGKRLSVAPRLKVAGCPGRRGR